MLPIGAHVDTCTSHYQVAPIVLLINAFLILHFFPIKLYDFDCTVDVVIASLNASYKYFVAYVQLTVFDSFFLTLND